MRPGDAQGPQAQWIEYLRTGRWEEHERFQAFSGGDIGVPGSDDRWILKDAES